MVTESRNYLVPVLVHLVGIAVGLYLGFLVMESISPDLPDSSVEPGISSSPAPDAVAGDDPDSLFRGPYLQGALNELSEQMAAGEGIVTMHLEPGALETETGSGEGVFQPEDVSSETPVALIHSIDSERGGPPIGLGEVAYMDLVATAKGPRWYVQLDINQDIGPPPWTYGAPLEGEPLEVGAAPPEPVG